MVKIKTDSSIVIPETMLALLTNDTVEAAAQSLGITRVAVYKRIQKHGMMEKLAELRSNAALELALGSHKAANNLIAKLSDEDSKVSLDASREILDRIGIVKPQTGASASVSIVFNNKEQAKRYIDVD